VLAAGQDGMWVTDLDDPQGDYNALYVYTYNKPEYASPEGEMADEDVAYAEPGQQLASLGGGNQEYLATSQLAFPQYDFTGEVLEVPDPILLEPGDPCSEDIMERLEGSLVKATDLSIPEFDYGEGSDYYEYGQWPVSFSSGDCTLYVESGATIPGYAPTDHIGESLAYVQGMLAEIWGAWIVLPRDEDDIAGASASPRPALAPARPRARPRGARP
jgi:hypothetical protein